MPRTVCVLLLLVLAACGGERTQRGSIGWDAGAAVVEVTGTGTFSLELNNNGDVALELDRGDGTAPTAFAPGVSLRIRAQGPRTLRLTIPSGTDAYVTYVLQGDGGVHVDGRVE